MKLLLGSGVLPIQGWITLDAEAKHHPEIVARVPPLPDEVKAEQWDAIMAVHMLEHLSYQDALQLVGECYEVLRPGGELILEVPNVKYCMRVVLGLENPPTDEDRWGMGSIYGYPYELGELNGHKWGYWPESLMEMVVLSGFEREKVVTGRAKYHEAVRDFRLVAVK